jgi:AcrR family transcriptional regulator
MNRTERRKSEVRERILSAAFELFLRQCVGATTIEDVCVQADVANRTFFNHFPTRRDMVAALAERRLLNLHDTVVGRTDYAIPARLVAVFDDIGETLVSSGDTYRELIGEMMSTAGHGSRRGSRFHDTFVELLKEGMARGEVGLRHDPDITADIVAGALSGALVNWCVDDTYCPTTNLHDLGEALADFLSTTASHCIDAPPILQSRE